MVKVVRAQVYDVEPEPGKAHYVHSAVAIATTALEGTPISELDPTVPIITIDYPDAIQLPDGQVIRKMWFNVLPILLKKYGKVIFNNPERNYALITKEDVIRELKRRLRNQQRRKYKDEFLIEAYTRALEYLTA